MYWLECSCYPHVSLQRDVIVAFNQSAVLRSLDERKHKLWIEQTFVY